MGLFDRLRRVEIPQSVTQSSLRNRVKIATPGRENTLASVAYADLLGVDHQIITRDEAMTVPAVASGRWLICHPLSAQPLVCYDATTDTPVTSQPGWLTRTGGQVSPQFRTMWTLDDLIFEGWSLWQVTRSTTESWQDAEGHTVFAITGATRVPLDRWDFNDDDEVVIDDQVQQAEDVILFQSPMDPLLLAGRRTIRAARMLEEQWVKGLDAVPVMEIRQTEDIDLEDEDDYPEDAENPPVSEAQEIVDKYVAARKTATGAVVFTPYGYELIPHGTVQPDMYVNGRNFQVLDIARHLALPPHLMGASQVAASLTYNNGQNGRSDFRDLVQDAWAMAFDARLSMDDVVPPGHTVKFDLSNLATSPDDGRGPNMKD